MSLFCAFVRMRRTPRLIGRGRRGGERAPLGALCVAPHTALDR